MTPEGVVKHTLLSGWDLARLAERPTLPHHFTRSFVNRTVWFPPSIRTMINY
jgi:hypothetical protein